MRTLQKRAFICIFFAILLVVGTGIYIGKWVKDGHNWVTFPQNTHIFSKGKIKTGIIRDDEGKVLISNSKNGTTQYSDDPATREAMVHVTGDVQGNISTGANIVFQDKMVGYNLITGTYSSGGQGRTIDLTVDADLSKVANDALDGRRGTVGVYNYKTGKILCMVSSPNYDPYNPPKLSADDDSATFLNRFTSSTIVPGSIFKVITATAALETIPNIENWSYYCTGSEKYGSYSKDRITDLQAHGRVDLKKALAVSCNCAFGKLANDIGADKLKEYTEKSGLMSSYDINGINTKPSTFSFSSNKLNLAWTGIGQSKDLVNPCSMMVYMGAIANGGKAANPQLIERVKFSNGLPASMQFKTETDELIKKSTADKLESMLANNVKTEYGSYMFPNLDICAKSGTAETSKNVQPNAWFTGFLRDSKHPYAFVVLVEKGGYGTAVSGSVANKVLQEAVKNDL